MTPDKHVKVLFFLGLAGVLFSGYLSAIKFFTSTCAFNEPCPYFIGYPACWYGFALFSVIFIVAILALLKKITVEVMTRTHLVVSALGILFAGYFTVPEITLFFSGAETNYSLVLPTCAYGLIFYVLIFILSLWYSKTKKS